MPNAFAGIHHLALFTKDLDVNRASFNSGPGSMAHLALYLPDAMAEAALRERLEQEGIEVVPFEQLGTFAFWDPNGIMVEIVPPRFDELQRRQSPE
jgi:catechol 2,3-dioxygenase-like lactoylglutathione lyase family enzyme